MNVIIDQEPEVWEEQPVGKFLFLGHVSCMRLEEAQRVVSLSSASFKHVACVLDS